MKSDHPRILLLGNNAGNNLGDAAILASILDMLTKEMPDAEFFVPTINPGFIDKNYGRRYRVRGVNVMPWTGSIRLFGLPTINLLRKCDVALICDGIIFGKQILNPLFNFLITLAPLVPFACWFKCPLVCYSCGIGPFPSFFSRWLARYLMSSCELVTLRESDSLKLAKDIGVTKDIKLTGDAAFLNIVDEQPVADDILTKLGLDPQANYLGINITRYFDGWLYGAGEKVKDRQAFLDAIAEGIQSACGKCNNEFKPLLFSTHPMDEEVSAWLADKLSTAVINNSHNLSHAIQAVMRKCELFIGMRFHSLVLASAVGCPIIGLIYAPKVKGYMRMLGCEDLSLELATLTPEKLSATICSAWQGRSNIKVRQKVFIDQQKHGALRAAQTLRDKIFTAYLSTYQL